MTSEARLVLFRKAGYLELEVSYNPEFIQALKDALAPQQRYWQPDRKRWWVAIEVKAIVRKLCDDYFEYVAEVQE